MSCSLNVANLGFEELFCNVSFDLAHKEKIAIVGENGCGKSTLLEFLAGLRTGAKYSRFEIFHHTITKLDDFKPLRPRLGFLFQDSNDQFIAPTVLEDVAFGLLCAGISKEIAYEKSFEILLKLGIEGLLSKNVFALSGGEKKLVALAGILVCEPDLIFLDEPTNNLNHASEHRLIEVLNSIDKSMIIVSHQTSFLSLVVDKKYRLTQSGLIIEN